MSRRIEIELTSARPDGTWTWRSAGALQPRGVLDGTMLYEGAKAGDVVRADADFEIDGITILAVAPPKEKKRPEPERLELIGRRDTTPSVTTTLTSGRRGDASRGEGVGSARRADETRPRRPSKEAAERASRSVASPRQHERKPSGNRPARRGPEMAAAGETPPRPESPAQPETPVRPKSAAQPAASASPRPKAKRLNPSNRHRSQLLESLAPEQRPIAEQVLRGGIPAVRTAIHLEREKAAGEGRPSPSAEALLTMAEELLPRLKAAEWHDRAEAAVKVADEVALRDLRSVVAGSDVARDDESRQLAATLREALERRVEAGRQEWLDDMRQNLDEGRLVRALRLSARPPDPGTRFPADLAADLAQAAGQALAPDTNVDRWAAVLDAVAASPLGRSVKPVGLPPEPGDALLRAARQHSGRIPALAAMLGISMPPPPVPPRPSASRPTRPRVRRGEARRSRPAPGADGASRPAADPAPGAAAGAAAADPAAADPAASAAPEPAASPDPGPASSEAAEGAPAQVDAGPADAARRAPADQPAAEPAG